jgi:hypothetical protein
MSVTLHFSAETERRLRERAAQSGQTLEDYLQQYLEREVLGANGSRATPDAGPAPHPGMTFDEILAPIRQEFAASGLTEEEINELLQQSLDEVRAERRKARKP